MNVPENLKYSESHEWLREEGDGVVTIGITDFAQEKMTELVYIELPSTGREVEAGDELAVVESVKSASDIYTPVSGVVTESNAALEDDPTLANNAPYSDGWLFRIRIRDLNSVNGLMDAAAYQRLISE
ncbi:MAG: glycine cleavage system protein GcvH [Fuerstiella sp.]|nr:glycine cleavage system protein GcvH [Fuerstiella sp.]